MHFTYHWRDPQMTVVGIGVTAFDRFVPAYFLPHYQIICSKESGELPILRQRLKIPIFSVEKDFPQNNKEIRYSSRAVLENLKVQKYLLSLGKLGIFVYRSTPAIERICDRFGWQIVGNRSPIRDRWENKQVFRLTLKRLELPVIEGETLPLRRLSPELIKRIQAKYGQNLVLKLPEVLRGGGFGNTFVEKQEDISRFFQKLGRLGKEFKLKRVILERKIEGQEASIIGGVTRYGVLTGVVQTQLVDFPEVIKTSFREGAFVGHDWCPGRFSWAIQAQAEKITQVFGGYLYLKGYRGIFGLDFLIEKRTNRVYPCECNPRYTAAFPVYSMIQAQRGEPLFDLFHFLEHLKGEYQIDFERLQSLYHQPRKGAHLILHNRSASWQKVKGELKAGVYTLSQNRLRYLRPGFTMTNIKNDQELIISDGVPLKNSLLKPYLSLARLVFPLPILGKDGLALNRRTRNLVEAVYNQLKMEKIDGRD